MAILFFGIGLVTLILGVVTVAMSTMADMGFIYVLTGLSTVRTSLGFFAVYAIIDRLDKLVDATSERRASDRIEPKGI